MKIIIDTREQKLLDFKYEYVSSVERIKLNVGDYACQFEDGYEVPVYFERKNISDLFGTMGKGYPRFKKEIQRAKDTNVKLILIIEGSMTKVLKGVKYSKMRGTSVVKKLFTLWFKYGLVPVYCQNREDMSRYIYEYYCKIGELRSKGIEVTL